MHHIHKIKKAITLKTNALITAKFSTANSMGINRSKH